MAKTSLIVSRALLDTGVTSRGLQVLLDTNVRSAIIALKVKVQLLVLRVDYEIASALQTLQVVYHAPRNITALKVWQI